jgi:ATP-dependent Clp protease protease subunit
MAAETWFEAQEAVAAGLADALIKENLQRPAARWDLSAYKDAPWQPETGNDAPEPDVTPQPKAELRAMRQRQLAARLAATGI